jgi:hypothetical protein
VYAFYAVHIYVCKVDELRLIFAWLRSPKPSAVPCVWRIVAAGGVSYLPLLTCPLHEHAWVLDPCIDLAFGVCALADAVDIWVRDPPEVNSLRYPG